MSLADPLGIADVERLDWSKGGGLLPAVIQDADSRAVLMLGYMNAEALRQTFLRGKVVFFSRSRGELWEKGETSGHALEVVSVRADCDRDTVLVTARPRGPTCHRGTPTCFGDGRLHEGGDLAFLARLEGIVDSRFSERPETSYTARLIAEGPRRVAQKIGEEGVEVALAGAGGSDTELLSESADLLFHLTVMLRARGLSLAQVAAELAARHRPKG